MNIERVVLNKLYNTVQSFVLLTLMGLLLGLIGYIIAGFAGLVVSFVFGIVIFLISPKVSPRIILQMYKARAISFEEAPDLYRTLTLLAQKAQLHRIPRLYYIPSSMMNAFSVGSRGNAAIALTDGLIRGLNWYEMTGVLAHEIGHIENNDLWIMGMADSISRFTSTFSVVGIFMLFLYIPFYIFSGKVIPIVPILMLIGAPTLSTLLQLALSRTREYKADINAIKLTGDPGGLISALKKIEIYPLSMWNIIFSPGKNFPGPSVLRSHPHTEKRILRLKAMSGNKDIKLNAEKRIFSPERDASSAPHYGRTSRRNL